MSRKKYYASVSFGKDSLCMLFMLIDKGCPLDEVVFYNAGMEFEALYHTRDRVIIMLRDRGVGFVELYPETPFLWSMLERPVRKKGPILSTNMAIPGAEEHAAGGHRRN